MSISSFLTKKYLKSLFFPSHNRGAALPKKLVKLLKKQPFAVNFSQNSFRDSAINPLLDNGEPSSGSSGKSQLPGGLLNNLTNLLGNASPL